MNVVQNQQNQIRRARELKNIPTIVVIQDISSQRHLSKYPKMASLHGSNIFDKIQHKSELKSIKGSNYDIEMEPILSSVYRYERVANLGKVAAPTTVIEQKQTLSRKNRYKTLTIGNLAHNQVQYQTENSRLEGSASVVSNQQKSQHQLDDPRQSNLEHKGLSPDSSNLQGQYSQKWPINHEVNFSKLPVQEVKNKPSRFLMRAAST